MYIKTKSSIFILICATLMLSCGDDTRVDALENELRELKDAQSNDSEESQNMEAEELSGDIVDTVQSVRENLSWNYSGTIGNIPIKAQINYEEATHSEGSGAINFPITGYYFYESTNIEIPLSGDANGIGMIYLSAQTSGGIESFDGEMMNDEMLEDFSGTWSKGSKSLPFVLYAR
ncbi:MAG: hypothetical protein P8M19_05685 [Crocinitomicaceae bacterium]|nr:hypothetical protein [Crocinitomicaceae bacterium]MDG2441143.1 hypothetical protein [Crocinitomicaceae bacterium]